MRKRLGIEPGGVVAAGERHGESVLRPAEVLRVASFTAEEIREWDEEDRLEPGERERILKRLGRPR